MNLKTEAQAQVPRVEATERVTELYEAHATGLVRLAMLMLADQPAAEDVVQDAFLGLYLRWAALSDPAKALAYVRSSVLNGCRDVLRKQARRPPAALLAPDVEPAETRLLLGEEYREVIRALRRLPDRQREAVILRHCLALSEEEVASAMHVSRGTVKSSAHRGLATLARLLKEDQ